VEDDTMVPVRVRTFIPMPVKLISELSFLKTDLPTHRDVHMSIFRKKMTVMLMKVKHDWAKVPQNHI
jgi:hypothetical protein